MSRKLSINQFHFSDEEVEIFKDIFSQYDKDGDGTLATKYVGTIMRSFGQSPTEEELNYIICKVDSDRSGFMDFPEFVAMMANHMNHETETKDEICSAFKEFDVKGTGCIPVEDLRYILTSMGEALTEDEVDELIRQADQNKDGKIKYEEFVFKMMSIETNDEKQEDIENQK